jgi:hypothetical protein
MSRVLLFVDDYSEQMFVQIVLKKLGFDVDALQNVHTLGDRLLAFHPQLMILSEESRKFSTEAVLNQATAQIPSLCFILLKKKSGGVDTVSKEILRISSPVQPAELITATARSCQLAPRTLLEKFKKFRGQIQLTEDQERQLDLYERNEEGEKNASSVYGDYLKEHAVKSLSVFDPEEVQKTMKAARQKTEAQEDIDKERRAFTVELFKKKKA